MTTRFAVCIVALVTALTLSASSLAAQHDKGDAKNVTGNWTMIVQGSPHGDMTLGLSLTQEGTRVTGTFASPHGDMPVQGDFVDGSLTLSATGNELGEIKFSAKLKDDGTLAGHLSSNMGDMTWSAQRVKGT